MGQITWVRLTSKLLIFIIVHIFEETCYLISRYVAYPGGGEKWGGNGVGDDLYSYGFDGAQLWTGTFKSFFLLLRA